MTKTIKVSFHSFLRTFKSLPIIGLLFVSVLLSGCGSTPVPDETVDARVAAEKRSETMDLNEKLATMAARNSVDQGFLEQEYGVGAGDVIDISVFGVEELNTTVRVNRRGSILLPLLGEVQVKDKSVREIEQLLDEGLTEYMHDPQVSVFMSEYHSQQVSVSGAINEPALHTLTRPSSVLELIAMSGGLTPNAGKKIYVRTVVENEPQRVIIDLKEVLFNPDNENFRILLNGGDAIFVPEAGTVFVEGAVNRPGAYPLEGDTGVVEALAMAGGTKFEAEESLVRIVSKTGLEEREIISVDMDEVRANKSPNVSLNDGDIVLVPTSKAKAGWAGFWRGFSGIFGVGYGLNGP